MSQHLEFDRRLLDFGYAPGGYIIKCFDCKEQSWDCDKRALRCKECAQKRLNESLAMYQGLE